MTGFVGGSIGFVVGSIDFQLLTPGSGGRAGSVRDSAGRRLGGRRDGSPSCCVGGGFSVARSLPPEGFSSAHWAATGLCARANEPDRRKRWPDTPSTRS